MQACSLGKKNHTDRGSLRKTIKTMNLTNPDTTAMSLSASLFASDRMNGVRRRLYVAVAQALRGNGMPPSLLLTFLRGREGGSFSFYPSCDLLVWSCSDRRAHASWTFLIIFLHIYFVKCSQPDPPCHHLHTSWLKGFQGVGDFRSGILC